MEDIGSINVIEKEGTVLRSDGGPVFNPRKKSVSDPSKKQGERSLSDTQAARSGPNKLFVTELHHQFSDESAEKQISFTISFLTSSALLPAILLGESRERGGFFVPRSLLARQMRPEASSILRGFRSRPLQKRITNH